VVNCGGWIREMLDGEAREDHIERIGRKRVRVNAEINLGEFVEVKERAGHRGL